MKTGAIIILLCCAFILGCNHSNLQSSLHSSEILVPTPTHVSIPLPAPVSSLAPESRPSAAPVLTPPVRTPASTFSPNSIFTPLPTSASIAEPKPKAKSEGLFHSVHQSRHNKLSLAQLRHKYPQYFKINGSSAERKVALTFDDGPDQKYTVQILDILRQYHVQATFFLVGYRANANPSIVKRIVKEGHAVGNHTLNHPNPAKLSERQFANQIEAAQTILQSIAGFAPKLIRTPYGAMNEDQLRWAAHHGYVLVNWDIDSQDWKQLNASQVLANVLGHLHSGAIILQHSGGGDRQNLTGTVQALPTIITKLRADGYKLVTVPELLHVKQAK